MIVDPFEPHPGAAATTITAALTAESAGSAATAGGGVYEGPFDREAWPERLVARVVEPGPDARLRGYAVAGDLARHHGLVDVLWLALVGELPSEAERAALDVACVLLAPIHVGQAAGHAALLSRVAGASPGATVAIAAVGLGELVRHELDVLAPWLAWLARPDGPVPACALAPAASDEARAAQRWLDGRLRTWFGATAGLPAEPLTREAQAHAVLARLGLRGPLVIETLTVCARLAACAAEAALVPLGAVRSYPARLPDYQYVDGAGVSS